MRKPGGFSQLSEKCCITGSDFMVGMADESQQICRVNLIPIGENSATHNIEKSVAEMSRVTKRLAGFLEAIRTGNELSQICRAPVNVGFNKFLQLLRPAKAAINFGDLRRALIHIGDHKPVHALPMSQADFGINKICSAFSANIILGSDCLTTSKMVELNRREQSSATRQANGPNSRSFECFGRFRTFYRSEHHSRFGLLDHVENGRVEPTRAK